LDAIFFRLDATLGCSWTLYLPWEHAAGSRIDWQPGWPPPRGGGTLPSVPVRAASCRQQRQYSFAPSLGAQGATGHCGGTPHSCGSDPCDLTSCRDDATGLFQYQGRVAQMERNAGL